MRNHCSFYIIFLVLSITLHAQESEVLKLIKEKCAPCHGPELKGQGGVFPNLWESELVKKKDLKGIIKFVIEGSPPDSKSIAQMPPRAGALDLTDEQIKKLAVYLTTNEAPKSKLVEVPEGMGVLTKNMGPLVGAAIDLGEDLQGTKHIVARSHIVPLGANRKAGIVFDSDTMAYSSIWLEGEKNSIEIKGLPFQHGHLTSLKKVGQDLLKTGSRNGWSHAGELNEPREVKYEGYPPLGHLPKHWAHFKGHYLHNDKVIFKYSVGNAVVYDSPGVIEGVHKGAITRTLNIKGAKAEKLILAEAEGAKIEDGIVSFMNKGNTKLTFIELSGKSKNVNFGIEDNLIYLNIPEGDSKLKLYFWTGGKELNLAFKDLVGEAEDLMAYTQGGSIQWPKTFNTVGQLSTDTKEAYVLDRITLPYENEYEGRMRIGGFDFFSDGQRAALSTWDGDVWIVSGIEKDLKNLSWKRYATGLHEPLGLKIVDDVIYTVGDDQITRFHDLNKDGEADFYENFNNDWELTEAFHAFCFDLQTGPKGDFFFSIGSPVRAGGRGFDRVGRHHGSIIKVSKDGKELSVYASGFRAPNGIGIGPNGQVTCGDNEGSFVPSSPIHWVEPEKFHGVVDCYHGPRKLKTEPIARHFIPRWKRWHLVVEGFGGNPEDMVERSEMPKPLVWLSKKRKVDNSGGGQVWTGKNWGPLSGELLHLSYGQSKVYLVLKERKNGIMQGGVVNLPFKLTSSAMRARVNPKDGQVYLSGLNGWQSNADRDGGFDRIRYTGKKLYMAMGLTSKEGSLDLTFSQKLDESSARDISNYSIKAWNLKWSQVYGSPEMPQKGFEIKKAELLSDGKTVRLSLPDLRPVHMMEINYNIKAEDGQAILGKIDNTLHSIISESTDNQLSEAEKKDGWELLFDGKTTKHWNNWRSKKNLEADKWVVENGTLLQKEKGHDIYTTKAYENFELVLEWKTEGNSGIFIRVNPNVKGPIYKVAPEMQIENTGGNKNNSAAGLYGLYKIEGEKILHVNGWNHVRIRMIDGKGTHWFNGKKVYEYEIGSADWNERVAKSKFKDWEGYAQTTKGHIGLQDHGAVVAFKNIKIKDLGKRRSTTLPQPTQPGKAYVYKTSAGKERKMEVYFPPNHDPKKSKGPGMILFHGGAWLGGSLAEFRRTCEYFASRGLVCATVNYQMLKMSKAEAGKLSATGKTHKSVCVIDAKSAIRWFKQHADDFGIDPNRIITGGTSAGGHISALATMNPGLNDPADPMEFDTNVVAYIWVNPAFSRGDNRAPEIDLMRHMKANMPPTIAFWGEDDNWKKGWDIAYEKWKTLGTKSIEIKLAKNENHGFWNHQHQWQTAMLIETDKFLVKHGFLTGEPTLTMPSNSDKFTYITK